MSQSDAHRVHVHDYGKLDEARKLIRHLGITFTAIPPVRTDDGITLRVCPLSTALRPVAATL